MCYKLSHHLEAAFAIRVITILNAKMKIRAKAVTFIAKSSIHIFACILSCYVRLLFKCVNCQIQKQMF